MHATRFLCHVIEVRWQTEELFVIRFRASRSFRYLPGQFISVQVPNTKLKHGKPKKRCYSLALPYEESARLGYLEIFVRHVPGGVGSSFLGRLNPGETFTAFGPFGSFHSGGEPGRSVCFIGTGTGLAPLRAMALSRAMEQTPSSGKLCLMGGRTHRDLFYRTDFIASGFRVITALSDSGSGDIEGRVTDYLKRLPQDWRWNSTVFYVCGRPEMVEEVVTYLREARGVPASAIRFERFGAPLASRGQRSVQPSPKRRSLLSTLWPRLRTVLD